MSPPKRWVTGVDAHTLPVLVRTGYVRVLTGSLLVPLQIRTELEMQMVCNLREFKEFIDNEMIVILGQMDSPTEIFDHVYLVSTRSRTAWHPIACIVHYV